MHTVSAIQSFVVVALLAIAAVAQDPCNAWTSCGVCTGQGTCGWCTYSGTCESGNQTGSFVGCTTPYWIPTGETCPATPVPTTAPISSCGSASDCTSCTSISSCGWCSYSNECEQGNATGSFQGCVSPYWSWTYSQCSTPAPPTSICSNYNGFGNCNQCASQGGCGYCLSSYLCEAGTGSGSNAGDCSGINWAWSTSQCQGPPTPAPQSTCSVFNNDCSSCTSTVGCGYCLSTTACEPGNSSGSSAGDCMGSNWAVDNDQCVVNVCDNYDYDCFDCIALAGCGFCLATSMCEAGNSSSSSAGDCSGPFWTTNTNQCPATPAPVSECANYNGDCSGCVLAGGCGYCLSSGLCDAGTDSSSNSNGGCASWAWSQQQCAATPTPPSVCSTYNNICYDCTSTVGCGYCLSTNVCEQGTSWGSDTGDCSGSAWASSSSQCQVTPAPTPSCYEYNAECNSCASQAGCGYCVPTGYCEPGTNAGSDAGDCSGTSWVWSDSQCQTPAPPPLTLAPAPVCNNYSSGGCALCTEQVGCGYCITTNVCESGSQSGSSAGDCSGTSWAWYSNMCTATPSRIRP